MGICSGLVVDHQASLLVDQSCPGGEAASEFGMKASFFFGGGGRGVGLKALGLRAQRTEFRVEVSASWCLRLGVVWRSWSSRAVFQRGVEDSESDLTPGSHPDTAALARPCPAAAWRARVLVTYYFEAITHLRMIMAA